MSYGSRAKAVDEADRAAEEQSATPRPTDVVMVKFKAAPPELAAATGGRIPYAGAVRTAAVGGGRGMLARMLENGRIKEFTPVFESGTPVRGGEERALATAATRYAGARSIRSTDPRKGVLRAGRAAGLTSLKVDVGTSAERLAKDLNNDPTIEYAYVPAVKHPMARKAPKRATRAAPKTDPLLARQWSHAAVQIHAARKVKTFHDAEKILVAIVDSGVDRDHPDLKSSIDYYENFLDPAEDEKDYRGHGTHVAGILAAEINNDVGIAGLCRARLAIMKALPRKGGAWNAVAYYRALGQAIDLGARVVNLSLGGGIDPGEEDVINDLLDAGIVVVAAMGNEFTRGNPTSYPAAYDGVIAVGATDEVDRRAAFSCTGGHIALMAPGERILSTVPRYASELAATTMYDSWPGTSMATPHVAAAAALLLAKNKKMTPAQVKKRLCSRADKVKWQSKRPNDDYGWGRLNIVKALG